MRQMMLILPLPMLVLSLGGCQKDQEMTQAPPPPAYEQEPAPVEPMVEPQPITVDEAPVMTLGGGSSYVVKKGDTLYGIARKHYGVANKETIDRIVAANPSISNPNKIKVGQTITLP